MFRVINCLLQKVSGIILIHLEMFRDLDIDDGGDVKLSFSEIIYIPIMQPDGIIIDFNSTIISTILYQIRRK